MKTFSHPFMLFLHFGNKCAVLTCTGRYHACVGNFYPLVSQHTDLQLTDHLQGEKKPDKTSTLC